MTLTTMRCSAPAIASRLRLNALVGRVAELGLGGIRHSARSIT